MNLQEVTTKLLSERLLEDYDGPLFKIGYTQGTCPNCGEHISEYVGDVIWYDGAIGQDFICRKCNHRGTEFFNTKFDTIELYGNNDTEVYKNE